MRHRGGRGCGSRLPGLKPELPWWPQGVWPWAPELCRLRTWKRGKRQQLPVLTGRRWGLVVRHEAVRAAQCVECRWGPCSPSGTRAASGAGATVLASNLRVAALGGSWDAQAQLRHGSPVDGGRHSRACPLCLLLWGLTSPSCASRASQPALCPFLCPLPQQPLEQGFLGQSCPRSPPCAASPARTALRPAGPL